MNEQLMTIFNKHSDVWGVDTGFTKGHDIVGVVKVQAGDYLEYSTIIDHTPTLPALVYKSSSDNLVFNHYKSGVGWTILSINSPLVLKFRRLKTIPKSKTVWLASIVGLVAAAAPIMEFVNSPEITSLLEVYGYTQVVEVIGVIGILYERIKKLVKYNV